ncbi:MAG: glycosyltransferase [Bacteriovorax sp.]|nr:glycosyltransferase [Bacteriovorax sp.]
MHNKANYQPIIIFAPGVLAGAEKVVITGTHALFDLGLNPHVIVIKESRAPQFAEKFIMEFSPKIQITVLESTKALDFELPKKINRLLKDLIQKDFIIHTHGLKALIVCQLIKPKFHHIHTHHGNTSHTFKMRLYEWMADLSMKRCQHIIAVSEEMRGLLLKKLAPYKKISVVTNMLSFKNAKSIRDQRELRSKNNQIHLIFIGRLSPEKGLIPFLENFNSFEFKDQFILSVLGDGVEKNQAMAFVKEFQLESKVTFYGHVHNPSHYISLADALILPSFKEGLPMTLIEALASGLPVLANDVGAIKDLVTSHRNGLIVSHNGRECWHQALICLKNEIGLWQKYTMEHASDIEEKYSAKNWALKTKKIYDQLILSNANESD